MEATDLVIRHGMRKLYFLTKTHYNDNDMLVPGIGFQSVGSVLSKGFPILTYEDEIYAQKFLDLAFKTFNLDEYMNKIVESDQFVDALESFFDNRA